MAATKPQRIGLPVAFGMLPEDTVLAGEWPEHQSARIRCREMQFVQVFLRVPGGVRHYFAELKDGALHPLHEIGANQTRKFITTDAHR